MGQGSNEEHMQSVQELSCYLDRVISQCGPTRQAIPVLAANIPVLG